MGTLALTALPHGHRRGAAGVMGKTVGRRGKQVEKSQARGGARPAKGRCVTPAAETARASGQSSTTSSPVTGPAPQATSAAEPLDTELPDAEPPDTELTDVGLFDAELLDAELFEAEPFDAEPFDAEPFDAEPFEAELFEAELFEADSPAAEAFVDAAFVEVSVAEPSFAGTPAGTEAPATAAPVGTAPEGAAPATAPEGATPVDAGEEGAVSGRRGWAGESTVVMIMGSGAGALGGPAMAGAAKASTIRARPPRNCSRRRPSQ
jgi:hypothetical protein